MPKSLTSDQKVAVNELLIEYDRLSNSRGRYRFGREIDFEAQVLETKFYDLINTYIMAKKTKKVKALSAAIKPMVSCPPCTGPGATPNGYWSQDAATCKCTWIPET